MAIDYTGKPSTSMTGTIGATPFVPKAPDTSNLGVPEVSAERIERKEVKPQQKVKAQPGSSVNIESLQDDDKRILNVHLTPSLKGVLNRLFGSDLFPGIGTGEPTISISKKIITERFGSVDKFMSMVQPIEKDEIVPPGDTSGLLSRNV
tara:strand:- start:61 stop:507 length:447 start_codon:yes stop_codon:yes gene_type:complete